MKPGETAAIGEWLHGKYRAEQRRAFRRHAIQAMRRFAKLHGVALTPIRWAEKRPGDDGVPPVLSSIQGPDVRFLEAEADVMGGVTNEA